MSHGAQLEKARQLLSEDRKQEALDILKAVLKEDNRDGEAWWLAAHALNDPQRIIQALQQVLILKPDHLDARLWLAQLYVMQDEAPLPERTFTAQAQFDADDETQAIVPLPLPDHFEPSGPPFVSHLSWISGIVGVVAIGLLFAGAIVVF